MWHFSSGSSVVLLSNYSCFLMDIYDAINTVTFTREHPVYIPTRHNWVLLSAELVNNWHFSW